MAPASNQDASLELEGEIIAPCEADAREPEAKTGVGPCLGAGVRVGPADAIYFCPKW
jgi:hypothetical protein